MRRHRGAGVPNISLTGIYGAERRQCRVLIESLGGNYTGNLEVNSSTRTTHLVCDLLPGNLHFSYLTEKMAVALDMGIPVVSSRWLKDSSANGSFLNESKYILDPESCFAPEPCSVEQLRSLPDPEAQASSSGHFLKHTTPGHSSVSSKGSACVSLAVKLVKEALGELPSTGAGSCLENSSVLSGSAGLIPETELPQLQILSPHGSVSAPVTRSDAREPASSTSESASAAAAPGSDDDIDITSALSHLSVKEDTPNSALRVPSPAALSMSNLSTVTIGHALSGAPTSQRTLQALLKHHALDKSSAVTFYRCVTLKTEFGRELQFTAGDITHGARMLYDVDPATGRREHALIVIKSIYSLETLPGDVWMEHHYLFTAQDIGERPAWAQALQKGSPVREGELILSCGAYFSPIHLVTGDFGVQAAVDAVCKGNKVPVVAHRSALEAGYYPVYHLRRGFDAARGLPVPLRDALAGFRA